MYGDILEQLSYISKAIGEPVEYTQGGGGNTSAKLDAELMAVKASGFKLKQITPAEGYVIVNYQNIKSYFEKADLSLDRDYEQESVDYIKNNVVPVEGLKMLRPSVEAGFHSILKKYVIHTHSVYAAILCCVQNGREIAESIFSGKPYGVAWIPYTNPGFCLTLKIMDGIRECIQRSGKFPQVILMENHGLIVTADEAGTCLELHREVNMEIRKDLGITGSFPEIRLRKIDENTIVNESPYIINYFKGRILPDSFPEETVLYPDQLVYLSGSVAVNGTGKKLNINTVTGEVTYQTNWSEAEVMEETLLAYIYVIDQIARSGLALKTMSAKEIAFIKNWESEAYRKNLVKESRQVGASEKDGKGSA
ncbi:MAG: class II aldolase/adducin family protein [Bacillota bacterium]